MSNDIEKKPAVTPSDTHQPVAPYVLDFIKFFGGFILIIGIALTIIYIVSTTIS